MSVMESMMGIKKISVKNFRAFKDAEFKFAPITILAGPNSSGKSSVLGLINSVLQTSSERPFPFNLDLNGGKVRLGGYRNVVHKHDARKSIEIGISFDVFESNFDFRGKLSCPDAGSRLFTREAFLDCSTIGSASVLWNQRKKAYKVSPSLLPGFYEKKRRGFFNAMKRGINSSDVKKREEFLKVLDVSGESGDVDSALDRLFSSFSFIYGTEKDLDLSEFDGAFDLHSIPGLSELKVETAKAFRDFGESYCYIAPLRANPSRYFPIAQDSRATYGAGEGLPSILAQWKENSASNIYKVKNALNELGLASDIDVSIEHDEFLRVDVKPAGRSFSDSIADVGFGLSQVLPMIVGDISLGDSGVVAVNQPEIHLHPSSQALLGNYFSSRISGRQYVIETHSEYLINRLRLLIVRGVISPDDVIINYCCSMGGCSEVFHVELLGNGAIKGAPKDFFSTYAADSFNIAMSVMSSSDSEDSEGSEGSEDSEAEGHYE